MHVAFELSDETSRDNRRGNLNSFPLYSMSDFKMMRRYAFVTILYSVFRGKVEIAIYNFITNALGCIINVPKESVDAYLCQSTRNRRAFCLQTCGHRPKLSTLVSRPSAAPLPRAQAIPKFNFG